MVTASRFAIRGVLGGLNTRLDDDTLDPNVALNHWERCDLLC
jgi:hypothetical protein